MNRAGMCLQGTCSAEFLFAVVAGEVFGFLVHVEDDFVREHFVAVVAEGVQILVFALYAAHF